MKTQSLIIMLLGLIFIFLASNVEAICQEPSWSDIQKCNAACENIKDLFERTDCQNKCTGEWQKLWDNYNACKAAEKQQEKEQEKLKEQKKEGIKELQTKITNVKETVKGAVKIERAVGDLVETVTPGKEVKIYSGDKLVTTNGRATIELFSPPEQPTTEFKMPPFPKGTIDIGTNSKVQFLDELLENIKLWAGKIKVKIKKKFEVKTPVAVLGVRGTEFIVEHNETTNITAISLYEGTLNVNTVKGESFELKAGEAITIDASGKTAKFNLNQDDWTGLTNSIETGREFIPSWEEKASVVSHPKEGEKSTLYFLIAIGIGIITFVIIFSTWWVMKGMRPARDKGDQELMMTEYKKRVQALQKKIQIIALIIAAIMAVVILYPSISKVLKEKAGAPQLAPTGPAIGALPSAYSITYSITFPTERGTWKEYVSANNKKIELKTERITTLIYILGTNYYSCTQAVGQWFCLTVPTPSYAPNSDPSKYLRENPIFTGKKNIAGRTANCYKISEGTFCIDSETNILLESHIQAKEGEYIMSATSLNLNPPPQSEFTLPTKPQQIPGYNK